EDNPITAIVSEGMATRYDGRIHGNVDVAGTLAAPEVNGRIEVKHLVRLRKSGNEELGDIDITAASRPGGTKVTYDGRQPSGRLLASADLGGGNLAARVEAKDYQMA